MRDRKNVLFFKQDPGSGFKILIGRIRIRPKMDRICNPVPNYQYSSHTPALQITSYLDADLSSTGTYGTAVPGVPYQYSCCR